MAKPNLTDRKQNSLSQLEQLKLGNFIMAEWESARMSAPEFAVYAREKLGIDRISDDHVRYRVDQFGLAFHPRTGKTQPVGATTELAILTYFAHRVGPLKFINALEDIFGVRMDDDVKRIYLELLKVEASTNPTKF